MDPYSYEYDGLVLDPKRRRLAPTWEKGRAAALEKSRGAITGS